MRRLRVRLRVRRRRAVSRPAVGDLVQLDAQYQRQSEWLAGVRTALLRRAEIVRARRTLEIGCATGVLTEELVRRAGGPVVAIDADRAAAKVAPERFAGATVLEADAHAIPVASGTFDLVCGQLIALWLEDLDGALAEMRRVLGPGGRLVLCAEPDYGGRIDHPADTDCARDIEQGLAALGADPHVGRKIRGALGRAGFREIEVVAHLPILSSVALREMAEFAISFARPFVESARGAEGAAAWEEAERRAVEAGDKFVFVPLFGFLARP